MDSAKQDSSRLNCSAHLRFTDGKPSLLGSSCKSCGEVYFPKASGCTKCCATKMEVTDLGSEGALWAFTIQSFMPKIPYDGGQTAETFKPYGVGYVEMPSGVKVEARLTVGDPKLLKTGMAVRLVINQYGTAPDGTALAVYEFEPA